MKNFAKAGIFAATALSFGVISPAHAGVCTGNGTNAASFALTSIDPSLTCTVGDKVYSDFTYTGFVSSDPSQNIVSLSTSGVGGLQHTIGMMNTSGWTSANNTFNYKVTVLGSSTSVLDMWAATGSSSIIGSAFTSTVTATNSAPSPNPNGVSGAFSTAGSPSTFTTGATTSDFTNTFVVSSQGFTSFDNSIIQRDTSTTVPGPLPLLGAGAAFGFSRRIRSRIKAAA